MSVRFGALAPIALVAALCCGFPPGATADEPSMPAAHPDFGALRLTFGPFTCDFHFAEKTYRVGGITELSADGRRAISHDPDNIYFSNLWYDAQRRLWINTSIYTFIGLDFSATSPGWRGGQLVFSGLMSWRGDSLPFRSTRTLTGGKAKNVEEIQQPDGAWHLLDTQVCAGLTSVQ